MLQSSTQNFLLGCCIIYALRLLSLKHELGWVAADLFIEVHSVSRTLLAPRVEMLLVATQYPFLTSSIKTELKFYLDWQCNWPSTFSSLVFNKVCVSDYITAHKRYTGVWYGTSRKVTQELTQFLGLSVLSSACVLSALKIKWLNPRSPLSPWSKFETKTPKVFEWKTEGTRWLSHSPNHHMRLD